MSLVVIFDEVASPQKVLSIIRSANTPEYDSRTDALINPDISALDGIVPQRYWKRELLTVIEYNQAEKDAQDVAELEASTLAVRDGAKQFMVTFNADALSKRVLADILKDEINIPRAWLTQFKVEVAAATSLTDLQTRIATLSDLPPRTLAQLKTAYDIRTDSGDAD